MEFGIQSYLISVAGSHMDLYRLYDSLYLAPFRLKFWNGPKTFQVTVQTGSVAIISNFITFSLSLGIFLAGGPRRLFLEKSVEIFLTLKGQAVRVLIVVYQLFYFQSLRHMNPMMESGTKNLNKNLSRNFSFKSSQKRPNYYFHYHFDVPFVMFRCIFFLFYYISFYIHNKPNQLALSQVPLFQNLFKDIFSKGRTRS